jgi:MerR family transcriptional regulator, light-induced transcriptional regulator
MELSDALVAYQAALRDGDARTALRVVDDLIDSGAEFDAICEDVLRPALYEIGELWERAEISVADEHLAAAISETVLACIGAFSQAPIDAEPRVLVSCTEGEGHALGARMVGETFAAADWSVQYLGASTPPDAIANAVADRGADVLALSTTMPANLPAVKATIEAVRQTAPGARVVVGGQAYGGDPERARAVGADAFLAGLHGLTEQVERLLKSS